MKLITVTLLLPNIAQPLRLVFKSEERAKQALHQLIGVDGVFSISDDFGVEIRLTSAPIARVLCDIAEELEANIEISLLQNAAQQKAQKRAEAGLSRGVVIPGNNGAIPFSRA